MGILIALNVVAREDSPQRAVCRMDVKAVERHLFLVVLHIELILLVLVSRCLDGQVHHTTVLFHYLAHLLSDSVKTVVVITCNLYLVCPIL